MRAQPPGSISSIPSPSRRRIDKLAFWSGFAFFFAAFYLGITLHPGLGMLDFLALDLPMLGIICVLIRRTRKFGLGLLVASLVFIGTAVATCGRVLEMK